MFLPTNSEIIDGRVVLIINSLIRKRFVVLPQNTFRPTPFEIGIAMVATNSTEAILTDNGNE
jgi:hypothetical protein